MQGRVQKGKVPHAILGLDICTDNEQSFTARTIQRVEEMSIDQLREDISRTIRITDPDDRVRRQSFEICLVCILHLKRCGKRSPRATIKARILQEAIILEAKAFFEYFLPLPLAVKAKIASDVLKENVFLALEHSTMISLLEYGYDPCESSISYNLGLQVWKGTWLHYMASQGVVLNRAWFTDANSTCVCTSEALEESVLDQALSAYSARQDVKFYNVFVCLSMGCEPLNEDLEGNSLKCLQFAARQVQTFELLAERELQKRFRNDITSIILDFYTNDWTQSSHLFDSQRSDPYSTYC